MQYVLEQPGATAVLNPACQGLGEMSLVSLSVCVCVGAVITYCHAKAQHAGVTRILSGEFPEPIEKCMVEASVVPTKPYRSR